MCISYCDKSILSFGVPHTDFHGCTYICIYVLMYEVYIKTSDVAHLHTSQRHCMHDYITDRNKCVSWQFENVCLTELNVTAHLCTIRLSQKEVPRHEKEHYVDVQRLSTCMSPHQQSTLLVGLVNLTQEHKTLWSTVFWTIVGRWYSTHEGNTCWHQRWAMTRLHCSILWTIRQTLNWIRCSGSSQSQWT